MPTASRSLGLNAITALSPNDIWAVGSDGITFNASVEHWNGHAWSVVATPVPTGCSSSTLLGVGSAPTGHVFAVGNCSGSAPPRG